MLTPLSLKLIRKYRFDLSVIFSLAYPENLFIFTLFFIMIIYHPYFLDAFQVCKTFLMLKILVQLHQDAIEVLITDYAT